MDFNFFAKNLAKLSFNFSNLTVTEGYIKFMFAELQSAGFTDQDFLQSLNAIINQEKTLFNLPTKAMFLNYSNKKILTDDQKANIEVGKIIQAAQIGAPVLFDDEITNETVHRYGGIGRLTFDLFDNFNDSPRDRVWVEKELTENWLSYKASGLGSPIPSYPKGLGHDRPIKFIGNQEKCSELLAKGRVSIQYESKPRELCLPIGDLLKKIANNNQNQND